jgi:CheY-like chemotaxis protein
MEDPTVNLQPKKILVVEDEQFLRDLYVQILTDEGYQVDQAVDGQEAYDAIEKDGYDLVLLDIMLPKMDGLTVLERLHVQNPMTSNKHIVLMTNLGQDQIIARALKLDIRGYLIKSDYTPEQLLQEIKNYLNEKN